MHRLLKFLFAIAIAFSVLLTGSQEFSSGHFFEIGSAQAQTARKRKHRSLFTILFGKRRVKKKPVVKRVKRKTTRRKKKVVRRKRSKKRNSNAKIAAITAKAVVLEKQVDARVVLVLGDFFAGGLADGLTTALADNSVVRIVDRSRGSSGLVRSDLVNWPEVTKAIIEEVKPAYIIAMVGTNDRQGMLEDGKRLKKRTPEWDSAYKKRAEALATTLKEAAIPFTWVGLPPVRFSSMNNDFLVFNEWYRASATDAGGVFVDVWDGFSDANGAYIRSGPDVKGQIVLLRSKDGINLTRAGRRRLAFYVEGNVRKRFGGALAISSLEDLSGIGGLAPNRPEYNPSKSGQTEVIRLNDPSSDDINELAGAKVDVKTGPEKSTAVTFKRRSSGGPGVAGRADNFVWPPVAEKPDAGDKSVATN